MRYLLSLILISFLKIFSRIFYRIKVRKVGDDSDGDFWKGIKIYALLNHTSLYEVLFMGSIPWAFIMNSYKRLLVPGANKTLNRPFVGSFFRFAFPGMIPITRKRDHTWSIFLKKIKDSSLVAIAPEGRMKRSTGLDMKGKPMSVMGGIADIISVIKKGKMILAYSGGLHHVQVPGQIIPHFFKTIEICYQKVDIESFIEKCKKRPEESFKKAVQMELEYRLKKYGPQSRNYKTKEVNS